jgi:hypothetical protein
MTALVRGRTNLALALAIPLAGLAYLILDVAAGPSGTSPGLWLGIAGAWLLMAVASVVQGTEPLSVARAAIPVHVATNAPHRRLGMAPGIVNVDRVALHGGWTALFAPLEALVVAWSVGVVVAVIVLMVATVGAAAMWLAQRFSQ